jgi:hypothetical protein
MNFLFNLMMCLDQFIRVDFLVSGSHNKIYELNVRTWKNLKDSVK